MLSGGIDTYGGTITLNGTSQMNNNQADGSGATDNFGGVMTLSNHAQVNWNTATGGTTGGNGGAIRELQRRLAHHERATPK